LIRCLFKRREVTSVASQSSEQAVIAEFVAAALAAEQVWSLRDAEGWALAVSEEDDEQLVMPFWTDADAAARCAHDEWSGFEVTAIPLDAFIGDWLPGMKEDGYSVGIDWETDATGAEVAPELLLEAFDAFAE
jgi:hypothetical protein